MSDRLDAIRERAEKATPGPWEVEAMDSGHSQYEMNVWITEKSTGDTICDMDGLGRSNNEKYDDDGYYDAVFLANAREDVPWLLEYVDRLLGEMQEARARAWDKGYNLGHHDGQWHMPMRLSGTPLPEKSRRNPYRANPGPEECSRHDTTLARIAENNGEGQG